MIRTRPLLTVFALLMLALCLPQPAFATETLRAADAGDHVGESRTVCGHVASTRYAASSRGRPTFLNLDRPYPRHVFTAVIWGSERGKIERAPERLYDDRQICVTGRITSHEGIPKIVVRDLSQIEVLEEE